MVCNICNGPGDAVLFGPNPVVGIIVIEDPDVGVIGFGKRLDLDVVSICPISGHLLQTCLPGRVDLLLGRGCIHKSRRGRANILSLWIPALTTALGHVDKWFVRIGVLPHLLNDPLANLSMLALVAMDLVGQGVEKAIAC